MQHEIYPLRANEDGELLPPVVVEVPDVLYLQVVDTDDCEDFPAPSEPGERTHCDERINASDVAYVPLARAERAEAEAQAAILAASDATRRAEDLEHTLAHCRAELADNTNVGRVAELRRANAVLSQKLDDLRAELDAARESVEMLRLALALTPNPNVKIDTASTASFRWPPHDDEEARP